MPDNRPGLTDRRILVTGAGSGIGQAIARLFATEGARLTLLDLKSEAVADLAEASGGVAIDVDVADEAAVQAAVARGAETMGGLDGVVNAAGIVATTSLADTTLEAWRRMMEVNMTGPFLVCRAALPWLLEAPGASIVNIASAQALRPVGASCSYAASKAGVLNFTRALAAELAPGIRANVVCPGIVDTPMVAAVRQAAGQTGAVLKASDYPLQRMAQPMEIAAAVRFLISDEASFITGATLAVDGGRSFH